MAKLTQADVSKLISILGQSCGQKVADAVGVEKAPAAKRPRKSSSSAKASEAKEEE
jgi:hypothetical protein